MPTIKHLLSDIAHRPYELPQETWAYYQEWNHALFLHWKVPFDLLRNIVPKKLKLDSFNGEVYISLVAFTMQKIRPRFLPSLAAISDFAEINLRTYIDIDQKKGVYFLNIEAQKSLSAFIARKLSGLPYEKASMLFSKNRFQSQNTQKNYYLDASFLKKNPIAEKSALDRWLTERYCLYLENENHIYRYDIHHAEWKLQQVHIDNLKLSYQKSEINLSNKKPDLCHYSEGVQVIAWPQKKLLL